MGTTTNIEVNATTTNKAATSNVILNLRIINTEKNIFRNNNLKESNAPNIRSECFMPHALLTGVRGKPTNPPPSVTQIPQVGQPPQKTLPLSTPQVA
ncbi:uncharacterized protein G2W53_014605 [Senna tora]|uniref:Uncharacterized protein n=1 Tax=Senna tora TaxID=362788 RepID=A0A834WTY8_9FABA|nr:uncharacterized protein G2W53_014605 [Senna tora]